MQSSLISLEQIEQELRSWFSKYVFARALYIEKGGDSVSVQPAHVSADPLTATRGIVLSAYVNGKFFEVSRSLASLEDVILAREQLDKQIETAKRFSWLAKDDSCVPLLQEEELHSSFSDNSFSNEKNTSVSLHEKIASARNVLQEILSSSDTVVSAQVHYRSVQTREFYLSAKRTLSQEFSRLEVIFLAILKDKASGASVRVHDGFAKQGGWELLEKSFSNVIKKMVTDGEKILRAKRLAPGFYDCIFSPSLSGILAHEAFGHGTESDTMVKHRAKGSQYLSKQVASPVVNLFDSPALEHQAASYFFDHEGQPAKETRIVENGILKNPMTDFRSACVLDLARTPNGRRESYDHKVYTRMSNTFFMPGKDSVEEMIASIEDGFFVDRATNGMEDPKEWGIQLEALYAERIKNGKRTGEVFSPIIVTGYVPDILQSISMVSDGFEINGLGMCGKGHKEWVKVTDGGPSLKLRARLA